MSGWCGFDPYGFDRVLARPSRRAIALAGAGGHGEQRVIAGRCMLLGQPSRWWSPRWSGLGSARRPEQFRLPVGGAPAEARRKVTRLRVPTRHSPAASPGPCWSIPSAGQAGGQQQPGVHQTVVVIGCRVVASKRCSLSGVGFLRFTGAPFHPFRHLQSPSLRWKAKASAQRHRSFADRKL